MESKNEVKFEVGWRIVCVAMLVISCIGVVTTKPTVEYTQLQEAYNILETNLSTSELKYHNLVSDLCSAELLSGDECGATIRIHAKNCDGADNFYPVVFRGTEVYFKYNCNSTGNDYDNGVTMMVVKKQNGGGGSSSHG
jgi:hypothetical protein